MKSPNLTVFLLLGFYLSIFLFSQDGTHLLGSRAAFIAASAAFLPVLLLLRRKLWPAVSLVTMALFFAGTLLVLLSSSVSLTGVRALIDAPPRPLYIFLFFILPGFFLVSELDAEELPHELSYWSGLKVFRPLIAILAWRERIMRRFSVIRETCQLRGIALNSRRQYLLRFRIWVVPLMTATVCEAAYAYRFREMLGSAHAFVPTRPKRPLVSSLQRALVIILVVDWLFGLQRYGRTWTSI
jgi:hypothetical protein